MTTDELRQELEAVDRLPHVADYRRGMECAITELEARDREIAELREEVKEYAFLFELEQSRMHEATAAWREATGQHNVSPDLGVLLEWLLNRVDELEANLAMAEYDTCLQVSADRDTKVAPEATILQGKDTHFTCNWEYGPHREPMRPEWRSGCGRIHPTMLSEDWHDLCPYCGKPVHVPDALEEI